MPGFRDPMIQLFRIIRRNLLESGKARSYILYALGEIVLVVVGILIALSINTWSFIPRIALNGFIRQSKDLWICNNMN